MNNLGEKIYELRTKKNMSQGDLADALLVSRQSVSKWETNSSVPDLDKIIKLSEIFEVSIDELVTGKASNEKNSSSMVVEEAVVKEEATQEKFFHVTVENIDSKAGIYSQNDINKERGISSGRKIAGWLLIVIGCLMTSLIILGQGIMKGIDTSMMSVAVFIIIGVIVLKKTKHAALWSVWVIYGYVEYYITWMVGVREDTGITLASFLVNSHLTKAEWFSYDINDVANSELSMGLSVGLGIAFIVLTIATLSGDYGK